MRMLRSNPILSQWSHNTFRHFSSDTSPLRTIQQAIISLDEFALKLRHVAQHVDEPHVIIGSQGLVKSISLAEIALHSRDASWKEFHSPTAATARERLLGPAQDVETQLRSMVDLYLQTIQPQMEASTKLCHETPCGGATWDLDWSQLQHQAAKGQSHNSNDEDDGGRSTNLGNQTVVLQGEHGTLDGTPCGRLQVKSMEFLETTRDTKAQILMASRARILLSLAKEFNAPLQEIRKNGTLEQKQLIQSTFQSQVVPTPWIRSEEEYQALTTIRQGLSLST